MLFLAAQVHARIKPLRAAFENGLD